MKIAYNPTSAAALTAVPAGTENDIIFDLKGLSIFAKGVRFKGTDTTYSVFKKHTSTSGGGYNGLVPVPSYTTNNTRFLREDGSWLIPVDNKVSLQESTSTKYRPVVLGVKESDTPSLLATQHTAGVYTTTKIYAHPNSGQLYAAKFRGAIDLDNADNKNNLLVRKDGRTLKDLNTARFNFGVRNRRDDNTQLNDPTNYGVYLSLTYSSENSGGQLYIDTNPGTVGDLYFRSRNAGDSNTVDTWKPWKRVFCVGDNIDWSHVINKPSSYTPSSHTHPTNLITALTGYSKATANSALAAADSLNTALGKLEFKSDLGVLAYNIVSAAHDGDGTIENLNEILKVLQGISDTTTILAILGNYAKLKSPNNLVYDGNEITMIPSEYSGTLWFNYKTCGGSNGNISRYIFGNGKGGRSDVEAAGFIRVGSNNNYFLTGGGSHRAISDFALKTDLNNYVTLNTNLNITGIKSFTSGKLQVSDSSELYTTILSSTNSSIDAAARDKTWKIYHSTGNNINRGISIWSYGTDIYNEVISISAYSRGSNLTTPGTLMNSLFMHGTIEATSTVTSSGFRKSGSSDSYLLLGGGGHKAISDFMLKSEELSNNLTTITKSLKVTQAWMDTGISGTNIPSNGTYIVLVYVNANDSTGAMYLGYSSGVMSWYKDVTNDTEADEIILHRSGHAYNNVIYLRTLMQPDASGKVLKLQISANTNIGAAYNYTFKFKRII